MKTPTKPSSPPGTITLGELRGLLPANTPWHYFLATGGKTGLKIHAGTDGLRHFECGSYVKGGWTQDFEIKGADHFDVPYSQVCARCFGSADEVAERVEEIQADIAHHGMTGE